MPAGEGNKPLVCEARQHVNEPEASSSIHGHAITIQAAYRGHRARSKLCASTEG